MVFGTRLCKHAIGPKICEQLKSIRKSNKLACLIAKAEVAFTYARLGMRNYQKALSEYEHVLRDCEKINEETNNGSTFRVPMEYICVWMYGNAL